MSRKTDIRIILVTLVLHGLTIAIALVAAQAHLNHGHTGMLAPHQLGWAPLLLLPYLIVVAFTRSDAIRHGALRGVLALVLGLGIYFTFQHLLDDWSAWPFGLAAFVALVAVARRVVMHNLSIMVGIAGIASLIGLYFSPAQAVIVLLAIALYDFFAVYVSRHTVRMAGEMIHANVVFGFIVPARLSEWFSPTSKALGRNDVFIVGSGDIGLPLVVAVSVLAVQLRGALLVSAGILAGVAWVSWIFFRQRKEVPLAALPPLAVGTLVGYGVAWLLGMP